MEEISETGDRFLLQVVCKAPRRQTCCQSVGLSPHTHTSALRHQPALILCPHLALSRHSQRHLQSWYRRNTRPWLNSVHGDSGKYLRFPCPQPTCLPWSEPTVETSVSGWGWESPCTMKTQLWKAFLRPQYDSWELMTRWPGWRAWEMGFSEPPHHTIQAKPCAANGLLPASEASNLHALLPLWRQKSTSLPIYNNPSGFSRPHRQGHFFFTTFHLLSRNELLFTVTHSQSVLVHPAGFCFHQIYALETLTG